MAEAEQKEIASYEARDGQQIKLSFQTVRKFLVSGRPEYVTDQEIMLYVGMCKARGLNPFKKDCYLVKYTADDPAATIVSIDYFRARARAQADCVGWKTGVIVRNDDKGIEFRQGCFLTDKDELLGGWFRAKPKTWAEEYEWTIPLAPYVKKTRQGQVTAFWREENQGYMIAKVAESQGLRRLWPDEFQGLFVDEEIIDTTTTVPDVARTLEKFPVKISERSRKKLVDLTTKSKIPIETLTEKLNAYGFASTHEITDDKINELTEWAQNWPTFDKTMTKLEASGSKQAALDWVSSLTDPNTFPLVKDLNERIKDLTEDDQAEVCTAFNNQRKAVVG